MGDQCESEGLPNGSPNDEYRTLYGDALPSGISMNEYRKLHARKRRELWGKVRRGEIARPKLISVQFESRSVDMRQLSGSDNAYVKRVVDDYYGPDHIHYT